MKHTCRAVTLLALVATLLASGCGPSDERWADVARQTVQEQTRQNERMAQLQQDVAAGAKQLVEADAQNRRELISLQESLQAESAKIGQQRDQLDVDRKALHAHRARDSLLAAAVIEVGTLLACLAPLVLCGYLLRSGRHEGEDELVVELLVNELAGSTPKLLPPPDVPLLTSTTTET